MADAGSDVEHLNTALAEMAERASADPAYRDQLKTNQVEALQNAGVSAFTLSGVFAELGAEEEEVAAFGMATGRGVAVGGGEPAGIIINGVCVGTCKSVTIIVDMGCRNSFL
ncbi:MAG: hypothetical protein ABR540_09310 [Acidimicrobiales bacterium]